MTPSIPLRARDDPPATCCSAIRSLPRLVEPLQKKKAFAAQSKEGFDEFHANTTYPAQLHWAGIVEDGHGTMSVNARQASHARGIRCA